MVEEIYLDNITYYRLIYFPHLPFLFFLLRDNPLRFAAFFPSGVYGYFLFPTLGMVLLLLLGFSISTDEARELYVWACLWNLSLDL